MAFNDELKRTVLIQRDFTRLFIPEVSHKCGTASLKKSYHRNDSNRTSSSRTADNDIFINNK